MVATLRLLIIGAALTGGAIYRLVVKRRRLREWTIVEGEVTSVRDGGDKGTIITVEIDDLKGGARRVRVEKMDDQMLGLGSVVKLAYDPEKPDQAFVADRLEVGITTLLPLCTGIIFLTLGLIHWHRK